MNFRMSAIDFADSELASGRKMLLGRGLDRLF